ncbi:MAG: YicC/YloC family endoribonuclease [Steroidobacteraceae bacterium]
MILSMTGFARSEAVLPNRHLVCELRSVNHRFLESSLRLPEELRPLEGELRARLQQELRRGKVDCSFTYRSSATESRELELDGALVERLTAVLTQLADAARAVTHPPQLDLVELLRFPGVLREAAPDAQALLEQSRHVFSTALQELKEMRAREGARLAELISQRCDQLAELVARVRARLPEVHQAIRQRFTERLAELAAGVDNERMEQEIALLLQRIDVAEELDRLDGHLAETRKIIASPEPAGRRLDFLMQEFNREANTLSSKSQDLATTRMAVDMKVLIEQMREQVQNIE